MFSEGLLFLLSLSLLLVKDLNEGEMYCEGDQQSLNMGFKGCVQTSVNGIQKEGSPYACRTCRKNKYHG